MDVFFYWIGQGLAYFLMAVFILFFCGLAYGVGHAVAHMLGVTPRWPAGVISLVLCLQFYMQIRTFVLWLIH